MARVLAIGSSNTDMTIRLPRLPRPGQTVLGGSLLNGPGGKGANQAVAAARAGGKVVFVTAVGDDAFGRDALDVYRREGVDVSHARTLPGVASGVALIFVDDGGENMIGVTSGANARLGVEDVDRLPAGLFVRDQLLLVAGLEVPLEPIGRAMRRASEAGMRVVLNPAPFHEGLADSGILDGVDVLTPNRVELGQLTGIETETTDGVLRACRAVQERSPRLNVVVTLGGEGCLVRSADGQTVNVPAHPVRAVDAVGAGDAFNGSLAVALAEGRPLVEAAAWANAAAALAVTAPGAQSALPTRAQIDRFVDTTGRLV